MKTMNRNLTRGLLPALLLSAALSVPAASVAASGPQGRAHAAAKQNQQKQKKAEQNVRKAQAQAVKAQRNAVKAQRQAVKAQQKAAVRTVAPRRVVVQPRRTVVVPQRTVIVPQRRVVAQRVVVPQRRVVVTQPTYVARNRRAWEGWNRRYSRYSTGNFQLEGTFIGQQYGCALVQDRSGQVIPLLGNPGNLRKGDYLVMSGAIQNSSVCGTAFRVFSVDNINGGDYYSNNRYPDTYRQDPYSDRDNRNLVSITGRLDDSGRCPVVRGDRGEYYDLVGDLRNFRDGDHARVVGFLGVRSSCGGQAIDVQEID
jgi:hypothetical protein